MRRLGQKLRRTEDNPRRKQIESSRIEEKTARNLDYSSFKRRQTEEKFMEIVENRRGYVGDSL